MSDVRDDLPGNGIGLRLRSAREAKGISLDEIAARTRIPLRHLEHIENGQWDALPAITYTIGFVRSYANALGLNGTEMGAELRQQLGSPQTQAGIPYEPADPARVPPRSLAIAAGLLAIVLVVGYIIYRNSTTNEPDMLEIATAEQPVAAAPPPGAPPAAQPLAPTPAASGPVSLVATSDVWLRVYEAGGGSSLYQGTLKAGERFDIPPTATRPQIRTGRPDALQVNVGQRVIPALGQANRTVNDLSLLPQDLLAMQSAPPNSMGVAPSVAATPGDATGR